VLLAYPYIYNDTRMIGTEVRDLA